jgi:hypothetical protein
VAIPYVECPTTYKSVHTSLNPPYTCHAYVFHLCNTPDGSRMYSKKKSKTCTWLRLLRQTSTRARDGDDNGWSGARVAHARDASFSSVSRVGVAQRMPPRVVTFVDEEDGGDGGVSAAR